MVMSHSAVRRAGAVAGALIVSALAALPAEAGSRAAAAKSAVSFAFASPTGVEVGQRVQISYRVQNLPAHSKALLQRAVGSGPWKTQAALHGGKGSLGLAAIPQGTARFRITAVNSAGRVIASVGHTIRGYAPVPLITIGRYPTFTVNINGQLFTYGYREFVDTRSAPPPYKLENLTCRSMHFSLADTADDPNTSAAGNTLTLTGVTAGHAPVVIPVSGATVTGMDLILGNGVTAVEVDASTNNVPMELYFNGTGDCYTASGRAGS